MENEYRVTGWTGFDAWPKKYEDVTMRFVKNPRMPEEEAEELKKLLDECNYAVKKYCIDNKIFFTDSEHQQARFATVPIVNDKYVITYSLRSWSGLMADVWNEILHKGYSYLDFYCDSIPDEIVKYLKENDLWATQPPRNEDYEECYEDDGIR